MKGGCHRARHSEAFYPPNLPHKPASKNKDIGNRMPVLASSSVFIRLANRLHGNARHKMNK